MLTTTIYKMSNVIAKSHQHHQVIKVRKASDYEPK